MLGIVKEQARHGGNGVVRATLEIEAAGQSPSGALIAADGLRRVFAGWAEFGAALEEWRAVARACAAREQGIRKELP
jgi:hypothetical protein